MLVVQNELRPGEIQSALLDLMRGGVTGVRICCAYTTVAGSEVLLDGIRRSALGSDPEGVPKTILTSLDFGVTEPAALEFWRDQPNTRVLVAGASGLDRGSLAPTAAFHPKFYVFDREDGCIASLVGSANLTSRGLTINTEVAWSSREKQPAPQSNAAWKALSKRAVLVTPEILARYESLRQRTRPEHLTGELRSVPSPAVGRLRQYRPFGDVQDPNAYDMMWVQSRGMQGGAGTQLELPRGANRFFGEAYGDYDYPSVGRIADLDFVSGNRQWDRRPLTWHGDNAMERINLPSASMGGFRYSQSLILFRRLAQRKFELRVYKWDSESARAYIEASRRAELLYRVGRTSNRLVGFIAPK